MNIILAIIIVLLIVYAGFKDFLFMKEREKLELKLMSKNLNDYVTTISPEKEDTPREEEDIFIPLEDATREQILKSKDIT